MKGSAAALFFSLMFFCGTLLMGFFSAPAGASDMTRNSHQEEVQALQEQMMGNQNVMAIINLLQQYPAFQEAMRDPEIMEAVSKGDIAKLSKHPKIKELFNDPRVQEINKDLSR